MPVYKYQGQLYKLSEPDPHKAIAEIEEYLKPKDSGIINPVPDAIQGLGQFLAKGTIGLTGPLRQAAGSLIGEDSIQARQSGEELAHKYTDWNLSPGAKRVEEEILNPTFETARDIAGDIGHRAVAGLPGLLEEMIGEKEGINAGTEPIGRTLGEYGFDATMISSMGRGGIQASRISRQRISDRKAAEQAAKDAADAAKIKALKEQLEREQTFEPKREPGTGPVEFDTPGSTPILEAPLDQATSPGATGWVKNDIVDYPGKAGLEPNYFDYTADLQKAPEPFFAENLISRPYFDRLEMEQRLPSERQTGEHGTQSVQKTTENALYEPTWPGTNIPKIEGTVRAEEFLKIEPQTQVRSLTNEELQTISALNALRRKQGGMFDPDMIKLPVKVFIDRLSKLPGIDRLVNRISTGIHGATDQKLRKLLANEFEMLAQKRMEDLVRRESGTPDPSTIQNYAVHVEAQARENLIEDLTRALQKSERPIGAVNSSGQHIEQSYKWKHPLGGPGKKQGGAVGFDPDKLAKLKEELVTFEADIERLKTTPKSNPSLQGMLERIAQGHRDLIREIEQGNTPPIVGDPKQRGGWTPFASSKVSKPDPFKEWLNRVPGAKDLPEVVTRRLYNERNEVTKVADPVEKANASAKIIGSDKYTEKYANTWTEDELKSKINEWVTTKGNKADIGAVYKNTYAKVINPSYHPDNPLLNYGNSKIHEFRNLSSRMADELLIGSEFDPKGRRIVAPGSPMYTWSQLKKSQQQMLVELGWEMELAKEGSDLQSKAREMFGRELSEMEQTAFQERRSGMAKINKILSDYLVANGKDPIHNLPNYWAPHEFGGRFLTIIKDKTTGEVIPGGMRGTFFKPNERKLASEFPKYNVRVIERGTIDAKGASVDIEAFDAVMRNLGGNEAARLTRQTLADALRKQGVRRRGEKRMGVEGFQKDLKSYEKIYEEYVREAFNYMANRNLDNLKATIEKLPEAGQLPNSRALVFESIEQAQGRSARIFEEADSLIGKWLNVAKLPQTITRDIITTNNRVSVLRLLAFGQSTQLVANFIQSIYSIPKMQSIKADFGKGSVFNAMARTMDDLFNPSEQTYRDLRELRKLGAHEATFKYDWQRYGDSSGIAYGDTARAARRAGEILTGQKPLELMESNIVRKPASLALLNMLREVGMDGHPDIYKITARLTDQYMVTNKRFESAHIFGRTGNLGLAMRPLQSFNTTWLGQFAEYLKQAKDGVFEANTAKVMPLATFLGINIVTGGVLGLIGFKEWDRLALFWNQNFGQFGQIPTGTEWVLSNVKNDTARFGVLSSSTGWNFGSTMMAPTVTGSFAPGISQGISIVDFFWTYVKEAMGQETTMAERREAWKGVTPRSTWGWIEDIYTPKGQIYTSSKSEGQIDRTKEDWIARKYGGTYTLDEVKKKTRAYEADRIDRNKKDQRGQLVKKFVDSYLEDGKFSEKLLQKAVTMDFNHKTFNAALRAEMIDRTTELSQRQVGRGTTIRQQRMYQLLQRLGDEDSGQ